MASLENAAVTHVVIFSVNCKLALFLRLIGSLNITGGRWPIRDPKFMADAIHSYWSTFKRIFVLKALYSDW